MAHLSARGSERDRGRDRLSGRRPVGDSDDSDRARRGSRRCYRQCNCVRQPRAADGAVAGTW